MARSSKRPKEIDACLPLNSVDFFVLAVLTDGSRHGYGIVKDITARTDGKVRVRPGNLYRVIDRLIDRGLVETKSRKKAGQSSGTRRYYGITALGQKVVAAHVELFVGMVEASTRLSDVTRLA